MGMKLNDYQKTYVVNTTGGTNTNPMRASLGFFGDDIYGALQRICKDSTVLVKQMVIDYTKDDSDLESLKEYLALSVHSNELIITGAGISERLYPDEKWSFDEEPGKKTIPADAILSKEVAELESLGFVNINDYCQLDYYVPMVYDDCELGRQVINLLLDNNE